MFQGYFDDNNKEYVITDMFPKRELKNYLWNDDTVCLCNQFGGGFSWSLIGSHRRQLELGERNIYIKDRTSGHFFAANRNYKRVKFDVFECHVGLGYQKVVSEYDGIRTEFTVLVPSKGQVVLQKIKVFNTTNKTREIDVYFYNKPTIALDDDDSYGEADKATDFNGLIYSYEAYDVFTACPYLYLSSSKDFDAFDAANANFCGRYNSLENPIALNDEFLSNKGNTFMLDYIGALQYRLTLSADESWEAVIACGMAKTREACTDLANEYANEKRFFEELEKQREKNKNYSNTFMIETPDKVLNSQTNFWLKRQLCLGKDWGRVYGKGFRDVMQDITAFVSLDTELARDRILNNLKWQYEDGNPIRMFEPNYYYPYNDGGVWIPMALLSYINESGDLTILDERIPYLQGTSAEQSSYNKPIGYCDYTGTEYKESVFAHVKKAMDYLYQSRGKRGLVLFLGGDWNDSMNNVGRLGKGESVWLTIATVKAYNEFMEILSLYGKKEMIQEYEIKRNVLRENVLKYGIDGDHLLYGFNDYDEKIGSDSSDTAKIFLNPQTWAVLAELTDKEMLEKFMDTVENRLQCDYGYMQCYPSYRQGDKKIGRVSYFKPGLVENGAVYNHGVAFKIVADCMLGRGDIAYQSLLKIRFDNLKNPDNGMEPYAVSNMYMGPENKHIAGYAPMSWITGTAGWLYRCITEYICGVKATYEGLVIEPCLPKVWEGLTLTRQFRGETYEIIFQKTQKIEDVGLFCADRRVKVLPLLGKGAKHKVIYRYL